MPIRSMTGFGRAERSGKTGKIIAELRSVNHRSFELICRLPENFFIFEPRIKELISRKLRRGKIYLFLSYGTLPGEKQELFFNEKLARTYYRKIHGLKKKLKLKEDINLNEIAFLPGVFTFQEKKGRLSERLWPEIKAAVEQALAKLVRMRFQEGNFLKKDLLKRTGIIEDALGRIKKRAPLVVRRYRRQLARKLKSTGTVNVARIEQEVGIFAQNSDITEEITRMRSHIATLQRTLKANAEVGKKLDFIAQELHREANTLGAKLPDSVISRQAIEIKSAIEKIREQVQNLE